MGKRFFVVSQGGIGDVLLTTPILAGLKKVFPGSWTTLMVRPHAVDLMTGLSCVDDVFPYDEKEKPFLKMWRKMLGHDVSFHVSLTYRPAMVAALAGIPVRIGITHKRGFWLTKCVPWQEYMDHTYEPYVLADILKAGGIDLQLSREELAQVQVAAATQEEKDGLSALLRDVGISEGTPYVVCSPKTAFRPKDWEVEKWNALFGRLYERYGLRTVLFGGVEVPFAWREDAVVDFSRRLTLRQVGELVKNARLLVNSCSMPLHLAAAFHTPCVALYGFGDPARWAPRTNCEVVNMHMPCSPCDGYYKHGGCEEVECMKRISVDEVFDACARMLSAQEK